jgi:ABC-type transport system involved in multi-copper enzyme maturation permease subunit
MTASTRAPRGPQSSWVPGRRLLGAEFLKLTRRRGLMIAGAAMTAGTVLAYLVIAQVLHVSNPRHYGPAGGTPGLAHAVFIIEQLAAVVAILVGAAAGTADVSAGVFRNLVSTGRSRSALFLARIPAGLVVSAAFTLAAYAIAAAASVAFAGPLPVPPAHLLLAAGGWLTVNTAVAFLLGLGLSALIRSRSTTVAVLLGLTLVVTPIAAQVSALPDIRQGLPGIALYQLQPRVLGGTGTQSLTMTTTAIAVVLVAWAAAAIGAGLWRTRTQDA